MACLFISCNRSIAQVDHKKYAEIYFDSGRYTDALNALNAYEKTDKDEQLLIKRGICFLNSNQPDACIRDMVAADKLKSSNNKRYKYTAVAFMAKKEYDEASKYFKIYLNTLKKGTEEWSSIITEIRRCGFSTNYKYQPQLAYIENLGSGVNTVYDEFGAVQSPTRPDRYYFTSAREGAMGGLRDKDGLSDVLRGRYHSDIYMVDRVNGNWDHASSFGNLFNTVKHEVLQDFSSDGTTVYFTRGNDKIKGTLYTDTFNLEKEPTALSLINGFPFIAEQGDKDLYIFNDSLIIFSSDQKGGYGGYDLYFAERKNFLWERAVNFGPDINTSSNEISPFMVRNGSKMYFSSDRPNTYGGYDIFMTTFSPDVHNNTVINIGHPINSPGNDTDIELSFDGVFAIFSSDRIEGYGGQDLFVAYFKDQVTAQLESVEIPTFLSVKNRSLFSNVANTQFKNEITLPQRDYVAKPLYFYEDEDLLSAANLNNLKSLLEILQIYPALKVDIISHALSEGKKEFDLYFSIKRAEKIADYLVKAGINSNRIIMFGCGANYPVAQQYVNGVLSSLAEKSNKRIDIILHHEKMQNLNIMYDFPIVAVQYRDTLWDKFYDQSQQLTFRIAFTKVGQMLKNDVLSLINDILIEKKANENLYTYTLGNYNTFEDAIKMKNYLLTRGFERSEVVPYLKGRPVDKIDIVQISKDFPQLEIYLKEIEK